MNSTLHEEIKKNEKEGKYKRKKGKKGKRVDRFRSHALALSSRKRGKEKEANWGGLANRRKNALKTILPLKKVEKKKKRRTL